MDSLDIRSISSTELAVLDEAFSSEFDRSHFDDLRDQEAGDKTFFVAWFGRMPAGHALVRWLGPRADVPYNLYPDCPEIYRLSVLAQYQHQGVASALIKTCEKAAKDRGLQHIGLGTDADRSPSTNLYYRLGYTRSKAVRFDESYKLREDDRSVTLVEEKTTFLIKVL